MKLRISILRSMVIVTSQRVDRAMLLHFLQMYQVLLLPKFSILIGPLYMMAVKDRSCVISVNKLRESIMSKHDRSMIARTTVYDRAENKFTPRDFSSPLF